MDKGEEIDKSLLDQRDQEKDENDNSFQENPEISDAEPGQRELEDSGKNTALVD